LFAIDSISTIKIASGSAKVAYYIRRRIVPANLDRTPADAHFDQTNSSLVT